MNTKKHTVVFSLRVPADLLSVIDDHAERQDRSRNQYLVRLIQDALLPDTPVKAVMRNINMTPPPPPGVLDMLAKQFGDYDAEALIDNAFQGKPITESEHKRLQENTSEPDVIQTNTSEPDVTQENTQEGRVGYDLYPMMNFIRKFNQQREDNGVKRNNHDLAEAMNNAGFRTTRNKPIDHKFVSKFIHENLPDQAVLK